MYHVVGSGGVVYKLYFNQGCQNLQGLTYHLSINLGELTEAETLMDSDCEFTQIIEDGESKGGNDLEEDAI